MISRDNLSAPLSVFLNLTACCNLRCPHCLASAGSALPDELTTGEWLALFRRMAELKVLRVILTGGEPLLHPDFFQLLETLDRLRFVITINTNATLVDDDLAERLAGYRLLKSLSVSVDGSCPAVHDRLRGEGTFAQATRGIECLLRHGLPVSIGAVVTKLNSQDLEEMVRLARELGVGSIGFSSLHPVGRASDGNGHLHLAADERRVVGRRLAELQEQHRGFVHADLAGWHALLSKPPGAGGAAHPIHGCSAGRESCAIWPDGTVLACNSVPEYTCGSIRQADLAAIWRDSPRMRAVRALSGLTAADVVGCRSCDYRFVCTTGCRADAWALTGSWTGGPGASCWLAEAGG